jgi:hypothetical protein
MVIFFSIFLYIGAGLPLCTYTLNRHYSNFSTRKWEKYPYKRKFMINDFMKKYEITGYSRHKVLELLGEPESDEDDSFYYEAGTDFPDTLYSLSVNFEGGKVVVVVSDVGL